MAGKIFINYRRDDSIAAAGRLHDRLAEAFGRDPDFFGFYRSMQAYEQGIRPSDTRMLLSPDSEFFKYFANPAGSGTPAQGSGQPKR